MVKKASEIITKLNESSSEVEVLPTGFAKLDAFLDGGLRRKELILLGGQTGIGKSYLAGQIQYNIAVKGFLTAYFSLEISNEMVVSRLIGGIANIKPSRILSGFLNKEEIDEQIKAQSKVIAHDGCMVFSDEIYEFEALKKEIIAGKYAFVVIDFIQNVEVPKIHEEYSRLTKVGRELQKLAKTEDNCILALSQLSNQVAREKAEKSISIEYRGSGALAHACDIGFFIERAQPTPTNNPLTLHLKKNRRGSSGLSFDLEFQYPGGRITEAQ
jgi:replicative DNA helicase